MTWGEFKATVEALGIEDTDTLFLIDVDPECRLLVTRDTDGVTILDTGAPLPPPPSTTPPPPFIPSEEPPHA